MDGEGPRYRLLGRDDRISKDDEFLLDDCITWQLVGVSAQLFIGNDYIPGFYQPMRRKVLTTKPD